MFYRAGSNESKLKPQTWSMTVIISIIKQLQAFRDMLAYSEGTDKPQVQYSRNRGYDVIVGGHLLTDYSKHPRVLVPLPKLGIKSTAAGRYQMIWPTWSVLARRLKLTDFSAHSQDLACDELLRECHADRFLLAGRFDEACHAARNIWASLPGSAAGQRTEKLDTLREIFRAAGGVIQS